MLLFPRQRFQVTRRAGLARDRHEGRQGALDRHWTLAPLAGLPNPRMRLWQRRLGDLKPRSKRIGLIKLTMVRRIIEPPGAPESRLRRRKDGIADEVAREARSGCRARGPAPAPLRAPATTRPSGNYMVSLPFRRGQRWQNSNRPTKRPARRACGPFAARECLRADQLFRRALHRL